MQTGSHQFEVLFDEHKSQIVPRCQSGLTNYALTSCYRFEFQMCHSCLYSSKRETKDCVYGYAPEESESEA